MAEELKVTVSIPANSFAEMVSGQTKPYGVKELIKNLIGEMSDEQLTWLVIADCLEFLIPLYSEEAEWYAEKQLTETFESDGKPGSGYQQNLDEACAYLAATRAILASCRKVLSGDPESVGKADGVF
jgi:hypothetical protein